MATKTRKTKPAPEPQEDEDLELEELEEDVVEEAPVKKKGAAAQEVKFGASDLAKLASDQSEDKTYDAKTIRTLLRAMARDGRLDREISPQNRTRYSWEGPDDPEVKVILKAIAAGEIEASRKEALDKLRENKAKKAAEGGEAPKKKKTKKAPPPVDEDDEVEELDEDDDE